MSPLKVVPCWKEPKLFKVMRHYMGCILIKVLLYSKEIKKPTTTTVSTPITTRTDAAIISTTTQSTGTEKSTTKHVLSSSVSSVTIGRSGSAVINGSSQHARQGMFVSCDGVVTHR